MHCSNAFNKEKYVTKYITFQLILIVVQLVQASVVGSTHTSGGAICYTLPEHAYIYDVSEKKC